MEIKAFKKYAGTFQWGLWIVYTVVFKSGKTIKRTYERSVSTGYEVVLMSETMEAS